LVVDNDVDSVLTVKANIAGIGSGAEDTATSGDSVSFEVATTTYEGVNSKNEKDDYNPSVSSQTNYVYASKVTAALASNQPSSLTTGNRELMKFNLTPDTNDNKTAQFTELTVNLASTGGATSSKVYLYTGSTLLASSTVSLDAGGTASPTITGFTDNINSSGETYVVKGDVFTDGADDTITTDINVNGGYGNDDVTWYDFSGGASASWIDLGEDSSVTSIENSISN
jgi:hypothetical protein